MHPLRAIGAFVLVFGLMTLGLMNNDWIDRKPFLSAFVALLVATGASLLAL